MYFPSFCLHEWNLKHSVISQGLGINCPFISLLLKLTYVGFCWAIELLNSYMCCHPTLSKINIFFSTTTLCDSKQSSVLSFHKVQIYALRHIYLDRKANSPSMLFPFVFTYCSKLLFCSFTTLLLSVAWEVFFFYFPILSLLLCLFYPSNKNQEEAFLSICFNWNF